MIVNLTYYFSVLPTVFLFCLVYVVCPEYVAISKCCNYGESFDEYFECSNNANYNDTDWFPDDPFVIFSSSNTQKIVSKDAVEKIINNIYSDKSRQSIGFPKCDVSVMDRLVAWKDLISENQFNLIYDSRKRVNLNIRRESIYHDEVTVSFNKQFPPENYCVDSGPEDTYIAVVCPCDEVMCIRKCCYDNAVFIQENQTCLPVNDLDLTDEQYNSYKNWRPIFENSTNEEMKDEVEYFLLLDKPPGCGERGYYAESISHNYHIAQNRTLNIFSPEGSKTVIPADEYCADHGWDSNEMTTSFLICFPQEEIDKGIDYQGRQHIYGWMMLVAAVILTVVSVTIIYFEDLEERFTMKLILYHIATSALAHYATAVNIYIPPPQKQDADENRSFYCIFISYLMQFSFLASFFWLNVMCIDMSYTFSSIRPVSKGTRKQDEKRKFLWYSLYSWGGAVVFLLTAIIVDVLPQVPANSPFKPNLGEVKCWFQSWQSLFLFFYGPMGVLLLVNLVLFIYTTWRIVVLSRGTDMLRHSDSGRHGGASNKDKKRYILYVKMFSLMGITWLMEIISQIVGGPAYYWYFTDIINILRAVFIFIIFCWKPRVLKGIKKKYSTIKVSVLKKAGIKDVHDEEQIPEDSDESTNNTDLSSNKNAEPAVEMKITS